MIIRSLSSLIQGSVGYKESLQLNKKAAVHRYIQYSPNCFFVALVAAILSADATRVWCIHHRYMFMDREYSLLCTLLFLLISYSLAVVSKLLYSM